jgi:hypothetical protein
MGSRPDRSRSKRFAKYSPEEEAIETMELEGNVGYAAASVRGFS